MAAMGTWSFSQSAVEGMRVMILNGQNSTDVVEEALAGKADWSPVLETASQNRISHVAKLLATGYTLSEVENDKDTGCHIVGRGGFPNSRGILECDAAIMEGVPGRFGAVAALQGVGEPCRVARKVMENSPHGLLVGKGAEAFALEQGFTLEPNENMLTSQSASAYQEFLEKDRKVKGHDTIGLIALDLKGNITVATGDGDKIMCYCPSFHVVQLMRQGSSPEDACSTVLADIIKRTGQAECFEVGLIAMNMKGEVGAASSVEFPFVFWSQTTSTVKKCVISP